MSAKAQKLAARYGKKLMTAVEMAEEIMKEEELYHINAFANPECLIITSDPKIQQITWGLIPFWTKTEVDAEKIRRMTYNARSETIFEKPSYRDAIKHRRCIIPSTGYFEYHHNPDESTTPYYIFLKDTPDNIFSIAGIYEEWTNKETGEVITTFSMITTDANEFTGEIHNGGKNARRMPLILRKEDEEKWLNPNLSKDDIQELLKTYLAANMDAYPISSEFVKMYPKDERIVEKV